ncbi:MAG: 4'-phosphopantetheinyl transferase superfamily protein [Flavobacteriales bacterium]|jgi:4'-phosphopantetheinyl transferase|nr:4'-phosphopantetheinyl transferase superfamily protein [Flavobacteriales bacterium]
MAKGRALTVHCSGPETARLRKHADASPNPSEIVAWYAPLENLQDRATRYAELLDAEELQRADRFRFVHDRERFILGHGLLREILGRHLNADPTKLELQRGEFGKPFLRGNPVQFNLSDTKDGLLVALAQQPVGADIETLHRSTDHTSVAEHYFTPNEVAGMAAAKDGKRRFLELWTRKEAVLKACGVGLMDDLHSLEVGRVLNRSHHFPPGICADGSGGIPCADLRGWHAPFGELGRGRGI